MSNRRFDDLLAYLNGLTKLRNSVDGYMCAIEINECINAIRAELGLGE